MNKKLYKKEYQQIHKKNLLDNPVVSGIIILILTFADFYVVENALEQIFFTANPLFLYLSSGIFAIGLDVSVYHMGCQVNEFDEIFIWIPTNHRLVKIKFHKHLLNGVHETEPDTWIFHLFYN